MLHTPKTTAFEEESVQPSPKQYPSNQDLPDPTGENCKRHSTLWYLLKHHPWWEGRIMNAILVRRGWLWQTWVTVLLLLQAAKWLSPCIRSICSWRLLTDKKQTGSNKEWETGWFNQQAVCWTGGAVLRWPTTVEGSGCWQSWLSMLLLVEAVTMVSLQTSVCKHILIMAANWGIKLTVISKNTSADNILN